MVFVICLPKIFVAAFILLIKQRNMKKSKQAQLPRNSPIPKHLHLIHDSRQSPINDKLMKSCDKKISKSPKPTKKPSLNNYHNSNVETMIKHYHSLLNKIGAHSQAIRQQLLQEVRKHNSYYDEMVKAIRDKQSKSYQSLQEKMKQIEDSFNLKIAVLKMKINQIGSSTLPIKLQKQLQEFQSHKIMKIELIKIQLAPLTNFTQAINKFCLQLQKQEDLLDYAKTRPSFTSQESSSSGLACDQQIAWGRIMNKETYKKYNYEIDDVISQSPQLRQQNSFYDK